MHDLLDGLDLENVDATECTDIFVTNAKDLGLLRPIAGSEILIPIEQMLEETSTGAKPPTTAAGAAPSGTSATGAGGYWDKVCFYIAPIGDPGSEARKHSDLFQSQIVEPAMQTLGLNVLRADELDNPGLITAAVIEHIKRAKMVVADLSMLNPNVFYELALRHACRRPIVQIIRKGDKLPFDVGQANTIGIDNTDIYSLLPQLETYKSEITTLARAALENPESCGNPITAFYPTFWDEIAE